MQEVRLHALPPNVKDGPPCQKDKVRAVLDPVPLETKCLAEESLGAVAVNGQPEGPLAGDDANAAVRIGGAAHPEDERSRR